MKLVIISDTHGHHEKLAPLPAGDVLIHAGDFTYFGYHPRQFESFAFWFLAQPHKYKVFIAGNHEVLFDTDREQALGQFMKLHNWSDNVYYLQNSGVYINDFYFYGLPHTPTYRGLGFNVDKQKDREDIFKTIPNQTNVLITHGPRYGVADLNYRNIHSGCQALRNKVDQLSNLKVHIFGHIHEGYGVYGHNPVSVNASLCKDHTLDPTKKPLVVCIE